MVDLKRMHDLMYPNASSSKSSGSLKCNDFDLKLAKMMLLCAANWTIEQATQFDYALYLLWFGWLSSKLEEGHLFQSFESLLKKEFEHPIWKYIFECRHKLASFSQINLEMRPVPLLSLNLVYSGPSNDLSNTLGELSNAVNSVGVLRLSFEQWHAQSRHNYIIYEGHCFKLVLEALQKLEKEILDILATSPSYKVLIELYRKLLDDHILFWNAFISSDGKQRLLSWHSLVKDVSKLRDFCPDAVENVLMVS